MTSQRTINSLDGPTERPTGLSAQAARARELRNVPLADLTRDDLRVLIIEQQGLGHIVPLALDILSADPDASGRSFPGDLLASVERLPAGFWLMRPDLRRRVEKLQRNRLAAEFGD